MSAVTFTNAQLVLPTEVVRHLVRLRLDELGLADEFR